MATIWNIRGLKKMKDIIACLLYLSMVVSYFGGFVMLLIHNKPILAYSIIGLLIIGSIHIKID